MVKNNFNSLIQDINKEDLINFYLTQNHNQKDTCRKFGINDIGMLHRVLDFYNIKKPRSQILECIKVTNSLKPFEEKQKIALKISLANKDKIVSQETRDKISNSKTGKTIKISIPQSQEAREKKSISLKKHYQQMTLEERKEQNSHIKTYFSEASKEQLEARRLKKIQTLKAKTQDELKDSYVKNLQSRGLSPTEEFIDLRLDRESALEFLKSNPTTYSKLSQLFNIPKTTLTNWLENEGLSQYLLNDRSLYEDEICNFLSSLGVEYIRNTRKIIQPQEIDIYLPKYYLGIEFNGNYWHSSLKLDKNYHFNKSQKCYSMGIQLFHIWEYEWDDLNLREKIKNILKHLLNINQITLYARNCNIRQITNQEAYPFNNNYHLQSHRNAQVTYGLFYNDELVQLMSFSKSKYNKNLKEEGSWEIIRECSKFNINIVGGVSKIFYHFINDYHPNQVFSYCDFNKFKGISYEKLGMSFIGYTGPDMKYLIKNKVVNRNPSKYKENECNSIAKIFGAGSKKYLIKFNLNETYNKLIKGDESKGINPLTPEEALNKIIKEHSELLPEQIEGVLKEGKDYLWVS